MDAKGKAVARISRSRQSILNLLRENGGQSRVELAARLGLTRAAVTQLANEMLAEGLLEEGGERPPQGKKPKRGRRRVLLTINKNGRLVFGAAMESAFLTVGLSNLNGDTLDRLAVPLAPDYRGMLSQIVEGVKVLAKANCVPPEKLLGIGVALSLSAACRVEGIAAAKLTRLKKDLSHALSLPITAVPLAEGAAEAEFLFAGAPASFLMARLSVPPEGAVLANGRPYRGAGGKAGGIAGKEDAPCLARKLAKQVARAAWVLDPEKVYIFGGEWETAEGLRALAEQLSGGLPVQMAKTRDATVHLCGCAAVVAAFFYGL